MVDKRYEVNWHECNGKFSHCTVTSITVVREGVLPGCTRVSISAIDCNGRKFQGSPIDYYATEAEAWEHVKNGLRGTVQLNNAVIARLTSETDALQKYIISLGVLNDKLKGDDS